MAKQKIEFSTRLTREDIAGIIEALVEGLKEGHLKVHKSGESLEMAVPRVIDLEIEAQLSEEKAKFELEVSWRPNREENPDLPEQHQNHAKAIKAEVNTAAKIKTTKEKASGKKKRKE